MASFWRRVFYWKPRIDGLSEVLSEAKNLRRDCKFAEAMDRYSKAVELLKEARSRAPNKMTREYIEDDIKEYSIRKLEMNRKNQSTRHEVISIRQNSTGHTYESLFGKYLDDEITAAVVRDPRIITYHECQNFLRFGELLIKRCKKLKSIKLVTREDEDPTIRSEQNRFLTLLKGNFSACQIGLEIEFSKSLDDRKIILSNGYVINLGRGLNIYMNPENNFSIGAYDMFFRKCMETEIEISYQENIAL